MTLQQQQQEDAEHKEEYFTSLYIHTHDVSRSLKPSADGELAHAIHQTLHFALDGHPDDYSPASNVNGNGGCDPLTTIFSSASSTSTPSTAKPSSVKKGFFPPPPKPTAHRNGLQEEDDRAYISYHFNSRTKTLSLPNPATITNPVADPCSPNHRSSYDITAKIFLLDPDQLDSGLVDDALQRLTQTTGIITVDTLILAFPTLNLDSDQPSSQSHPSWLQPLKQIYTTVSQNPQIFSLGISDISKPNLELLLSSLDPPVQPPTVPIVSPSIPLSSSSTQPSATSVQGISNSDVNSNTVSTTDPSNQVAASGSAAWNSDFTVPSPSRRPRLITINVNENPNSFDKQIVDYCENMGLQLVAHSDKKNVLPSRTIPALLDEFSNKMPYNLPPSSSQQPASSLKPKWALKYTTLIRDRGVLADKGYIVYLTTLSV